MDYDALVKSLKASDGACDVGVGGVTVSTELEAAGITVRPAERRTAHRCCTKVANCDSRQCCNAPCRGARDDSVHVGVVQAFALPALGNLKQLNVGVVKSCSWAATKRRLPAHPIALLPRCPRPSPASSLGAMQGFLPAMVAAACSSPTPLTHPAWRCWSRPRLNPQMGGSSSSPSTGGAGSQLRMYSLCMHAGDTKRG